MQLLFLAAKVKIFRPFKESPQIEGNGVKICIYFDAKNTEIYAHKDSSKSLWEMQIRIKLCMDFKFFLPQK